MSHSREWQEFFDGSPEPDGDVEPDRRDQERALMLCALTGSPERARKLLGFGSKQTLFRIARGDLVRGPTLSTFRSKIDQAERTAEILRRRHWSRVCGLPLEPLDQAEHARLQAGLGSSEAAMFARELGLKPETLDQSEHERRYRALLARSSQNGAKK